MRRVGFLWLTTLLVAGLPATALAMGDPSSEYCSGLGYTLEPYETPEGQGESCVFPDGTKCDTWQFIGGTCGQEFSMCASEGGKLEAGSGDICPPELGLDQCGVCTLESGAQCAEWRLYQGLCPAASDETSDGSCAAGAGENPDVSFLAVLCAGVLLLTRRRALRAA